MATFQLFPNAFSHTKSSEYQLSTVMDNTKNDVLIFIFV